MNALFSLNKSILNKSNQKARSVSPECNKPKSLESTKLLVSKMAQSSEPELAQLKQENKEYQERIKDYEFLVMKASEEVKRKQTEVEQLTSRILELQQGGNNTSNNSSEYQNQLIDSKAQIKMLEETLKNEKDRMQTEIDEHKRINKELQEKLNFLQNSMEKMQADTHASLGKVQKEYVNFTEKYKQLQKEYERTVGKMEEMQEQSQVKDSAINNAHQIIKKLKSDMNDISSEAEENQAKVKEYKNKCKTLKKNNKAHMEKIQELENKSKENAQLSQELQQAKDDLQSFIQSKIADKNKQAIEKDEIEKENQQFKTLIQSLRGEIKKLENTNSDLEQKFQEEQSKTKELCQQLLQRENDVKHLKEELQVENQKAKQKLDTFKSSVTKTLQLINPNFTDLPPIAPKDRTPNSMNKSPFKQTINAAISEFQIKPPQTGGILDSDKKFLQNINTQLGVIDTNENNNNQLEGHHHSRSIQQNGNQTRRLSGGNLLKSTPIKMFSSNKSLQSATAPPNNSIIVNSIQINNENLPPSTSSTSNCPNKQSSQNLVSVLKQRNDNILGSVRIDSNVLQNGDENDNQSPLTRRKDEFERLNSVQPLQTTERMPTSSSDKDHLFNNALLIGNIASQKSDKTSQQDITNIFSVGLLKDEIYNQLERQSYLHDLMETLCSYATKFVDDFMNKIETQPQEAPIVQELKDLLNTKNEEINKLGSQYEDASSLIQSLIQNNKLLMDKLSCSLDDLAASNKKNDELMELLKDEISFREVQQKEMVQESKTLFTIVENTELTTRREMKISTERNQQLNFEFEIAQMEIKQIEEIVDEVRQFDRKDLSQYTDQFDSLPQIGNNNVLRKSVVQKVLTAFKYYQNELNELEEEKHRLLNRFTKNEEETMDVKKLKKLKEGELIDKIKNKEIQLEEIRVTLDQKRMDVCKLNDHIADLKLQIHQAESELNERGDLIQRLLEEKEVIQDRFHNLLEEHSKAKKQISEQEKEFQRQVRDLDIDITYKDNELTGRKLRYEHSLKQIELKDKEINTLEEQLSQAQKEASENREEFHKSQVELKQRTKDLNEQLHIKEMLNSDLNDQVTKLKNELQTVTGTIEQQLQQSKSLTKIDDTSLSPFRSNSQHHAELNFSSEMDKLKIENKELLQKLNKLNSLISNNMALESEYRLQTAEKSNRDKLSLFGFGLTDRSMPGGGIPSPLNSKSPNQATNNNNLYNLMNSTMRSGRSATPTSRRGHDQVQQSLLQESKMNQSRSVATKSPKNTSIINEIPNFVQAVEEAKSKSDFITTLTSATTTPTNIINLSSANLLKNKKNGESNSNSNGTSMSNNNPTHKSNNHQNHNNNNNNTELTTANTMIVNNTGAGGSNMSIEQQEKYLEKYKNKTKKVFQKRVKELEMLLRYIDMKVKGYDFSKSSFILNSGNYEFLSYDEVKNLKRLSLVVQNLLKKNVNLSSFIDQISANIEKMYVQNYNLTIVLARLFKNIYQKYGNTETINSLQEHGLLDSLQQLFDFEIPELVTRYGDLDTIVTDKNREDFFNFFEKLEPKIDFIGDYFSNQLPKQVNNMSNNNNPNQNTPGARVNTQSAYNTNVEDKDYLYSRLQKMHDIETLYLKLHAVIDKSNLSQSWVQENLASYMNTFDEIFNSVLKEANYMIKKAITNDSFTPKKYNITLPLHQPLYDVGGGHCNQNKDTYSPIKPLNNQYGTSGFINSVTNAFSSNNLHNPFSQNSTPLKVSQLEMPSQFDEKSKFFNLPNFDFSQNNSTSTYRNHRVSQATPDKTKSYQTQQKIQSQKLQEQQQQQPNKITPEHHRVYTFQTPPQDSQKVLHSIIGKIDQMNNVEQGPNSNTLLQNHKSNNDNQETELSYEDLLNQRDENRLF